MVKQTIAKVRREYTASKYKELKKAGNNEHVQHMNKKRLETAQKMKRVQETAYTEEGVGGVQAQGEGKQ